MQQSRRALIGQAILPLSLYSCGSIRDASKGISGVFQLRAALAQWLGHPDISVNLVNGVALAIKIVNSPWSAKPIEVKKAKALDICRFAYQNYELRTNLVAVSTSFATQKNFILLHLESVDAAFTAPARDLANAPRLQTSQ